MISAYTHVGSKIGVLVELERITPDGAAAGIGRDVAMQVAAMNPKVVGREQVDKAMIDRELEIYRTQAKNEGKKDQIIDRIAQGKLEKYFQEVCLLEQTFIKDPGKTIKDVLKDSSPATGNGVQVRKFIRFHLGEESR